MHASPNYVHDWLLLPSRAGTSKQKTKDSLADSKDTHNSIALHIIHYSQKSTQEFYCVTDHPAPKDVCPSVRFSVQSAAISLPS